jgi:hypothetical protein
MGKKFSLLHDNQTGSGTQWVPGVLSLEVKRLELEADH